MVVADRLSQFLFTPPAQNEGIQGYSLHMRACFFVQVGPVKVEKDETLIS
jgi:hypothetical protein